MFGLLDKFMDNYHEFFVFFIIIIKILFVFTAVSHLILSNLIKYKKYSDVKIFDKTLLYWKPRFELLFFISTSILLIYYFNPRENRIHRIDYETSFILFLFGWITIITANWGLFLP